MNNKKDTKNKKNIVMHIAYDGTNYHGFQRQKNNLAIQNILEKVLSAFLLEKIEITAASRTDAGVHGENQVINFFSSTKIPVERLPYALNRILPKDIRIKKAFLMGNDFSALHSSTGKEYIYKVYEGEYESPFLDKYALYVKEPLDILKMRKALNYLIGTFDFTSFKSNGGSKTLPIRTIYKASVTKIGSEYIFHFHGSGFLYHMVRNIMGVVIRVGEGKIEPEEMKIILEGRDRDLAGKMAEAKGLYLVKVHYDNHNL